MISRRRLMLIQLGDPNQHYDSDGNGYDVDALSISNLLVEPSSDTDKDSENLGINITITLESA